MADQYPIVTLNDKTSLPGIGFGVGTAWYAVPENENGVNSNLVKVVQTAIKQGYTHLDNAECYANETSVGAAIKASGVSRESLYITTKIADGLNDLRGNFKKQLVKLGVSYVDLFLIHWPYEYGKPGFPTNEEAWKIMEELHDEGLAKSIGVSNYRVADLEKTMAVARIIPSVNQIELHPYVLEKSGPLLAYMKKYDIRVEAYGPTSPVTKFQGGPIDPILAQIAAAVQSRQKNKDAKVEPSQILLHWIQQEGWVVITTSGKDWRMDQQLAAGGLPALLESEMQAIRDSGNGHHQRGFMEHMDAATVY